MDIRVDLPAPAAAEGGLDDLSRWLGRREAFGMMAGRCSAADVECMQHIRDEKLYLKCATDWGEFCEKFLHMSRSNANHLIGLREKLGAEYFLVAQITGISVSEYRTVAPAVGPLGIECHGELIPLTPENSERIAAAVATLRAAAAPEPKSKPSFQDRLAALNAAVDRLLKQFRDLHENPGNADPQLARSVASLRTKVERLSLEIR